MNSATRLRARKLHLDFHAPGVVQQIGNRFDKQAFGDTLARANINSAVLLTKCHCGYSYYDTQAGVPVTLLRCAGLIHRFAVLAGVLDQGSRVIEEAAHILRQNFATRQTK